MKFHIYYNEFGEPYAHIEAHAFEIMQMNSALLSAVRDRVKWITENHDEKYQDRRLESFSELAQVSGAVGLIEQTLWPLYEAFVDGDMACPECAAEDEEEDDDAHA